MLCLYCNAPVLANTKYCSVHWGQRPCAVAACSQLAASADRLLCEPHEGLFQASPFSVVWVFCQDLQQRTSIPIEYCPVADCGKPRLMGARRCWTHRGVQGQYVCVVNDCQEEVGTGGVFCPTHNHEHDAWTRTHPLGGQTRTGYFVNWLLSLQRPTPTTVAAPPAEHRGVGLCEVEGCAAPHMPYAKRCWSHKAVWNRPRCLVGGCTLRSSGAGMQCEPHLNVYVAWLEAHYPSVVAEESHFVEWAQSLFANAEELARAPQHDWVITAEELEGTAHREYTCRRCDSSCTSQPPSLEIPDYARAWPCEATASTEPPEYLAWATMLCTRHPRFWEDVAQADLDAMVPRWQANREYYPCERGQCWEDAMEGSRFCVACLDDGRADSAVMPCACRDCPKPARDTRSIFCNECKLRFHAGVQEEAVDWLCSQEARYVAPATANTEGQTPTEVAAESTSQGEPTALPQCSIEDCPETVPPGFSWCVHHTCHRGDCRSEVDYDSSFCSRTCRTSTGPLRRRGNTQAERRTHTCQALGCERQRFEEEGSPERTPGLSSFCARHVCLSPRCLLGCISEEIRYCPHHHEERRQAAESQVQGTLGPTLEARQTLAAAVGSSLDRAFRARFERAPAITSRVLAEVEAQVQETLRSLEPPPQVQVTGTMNDAGVMTLDVRVRRGVFTATILVGPPAPAQCVSGQCQAPRRQGGALCEAHHQDLQKR